MKPSKSLELFCPDCGPVGVSHWAERFSARLDPVMEAFTKPAELTWFAIRPAIHAIRLERIAPLFFNLLAFLRIGIITTAPDKKNNWRARVIWEEAGKRGIVMKEFRPFGLARECFWASYRGETQLFEGLPRLRFSSE